ncbi:putative sulfate exporter family transporter [Rhodococcus sp. BL-253-APC-6A1W]|uniref:putative sulfate exporter family transporter n=1 Tax=Rhodococcus sp. BL-253-APC-6A1W TaxID=2725307 RepID=UPI00146A84C6|nr:putative sulfate exporter family transporter [Rhodococcus sp. BL-253-APC-6A1W]
MTTRDTDGRNAAVETESAPRADGATKAEAAPARRSSAPAWAAAGVAVVIVLGGLTRFLEQNVPDWAEGGPFERVAGAIEFPVYAIAIGLLGNLVLTRTGVRDKLSGGFRTEFFIKTGLVLLGASINLTVLATAAGPAILQGLLLITAVFSFSWWFGGKLGLDEKLRALLSAAVSICGVSAAIAAAGAVQAKKEQLAYAASLVIVFALPSIFLLPWLAGVFGLSDVVAGAWIGGNIDTTAAVAASGAILGDDALQIATIVKTTQNALIGFVAVGLTAYFALKVERRPGSARPSIGDFWERFPKFVLGFIAASIIGTLWVKFVDDGKADISTINDLRTWFLIFAFVSIGLEFSAKGLRDAGWRPVVVFGSATVVNIVVALGLATVLFGNFELPQ